MINDFFINSTILISLLFLYCEVGKNHPLNQQSTLVTRILGGLYGGLLGNILMIYSIQLTGDIRVDLRHIPMIIAMLYGGWTSALVTMVMVAAGRLLYGVTTVAIMTTLLSCCLFVVLWFVQRTRWRFSIKAFAMAVVVIISTSLLLIAVLDEWSMSVRIIPLYTLVYSLGTWLSITLFEHTYQRHSLFKTYEEASYRDELTGLGNVRYFRQVYQACLENARGKDEELSLLYLDIDHFKNINDTHGHAEGDYVLKEVGKVLLELTRSYDIVCRNGGEEFSVLLPDCPPAKAFEVAERIRGHIQHHSFLLQKGTKVSVTISIGLAHYPTVKAGMLIEVADQALYRAKQMGRNQVQQLPAK
ncbi:hypothetical protein A374_06756 [Fictibacillus macauensis ZFHKF-1]|uniref:GGDEF domain-containing protein n=1 Tax=Fictibacillus macauensis ZFHKF-1 TaxID=1196324 RepID=I8AL01_9BACL|nr:diguanylate cyclase [Fictibacillus macauensis]EIT86279.1 hypothetical protein A374_06756 [Fictibacillus macauensis ZFHKF-1]